MRAVVSQGQEAAPPLSFLACVQYDVSEPNAFISNAMKSVAFLQNKLKHSILAVLSVYNSVNYIFIAYDALRCPCFCSLNWF
jgi:hypothetical protein